MVAGGCDVDGGDAWCELQSYGPADNVSADSWLLVGTGPHAARGCDSPCAAASSEVSLVSSLGHQVLAARELQYLAGAPEFGHLCEAIVHGDVDGVRAVLLGQDFDKHNETVPPLRTTALHLAAQRGDLQIVQLLLDDPLLTVHDARDLNGETALHHACKADDVQVVRALVDHPRFTAVDAQDVVGRTALDRAAFEGRLDAVRCLVGHHRFTALNAATTRGRTALHSAAWGNHAGVAQVLLDTPHFTACDAQDLGGMTPLHSAAQRGHVETVEVLLKHRRFLGVNSVDSGDLTALDRAYMEGHMAVVEILLDVQNNGLRQDVDEAWVARGGLARDIEADLSDSDSFGDACAEDPMSMYTHAADLMQARHHERSLARCRW